MRFIRAIAIAFSTYTRIPMPRVSFYEEAMQLAIGFLPLVGAAVGGIAWGFYLFCVHFELSAILFAAIATALPIMITGGIHMDGYCDTSDALASYQNKERRLEILSDPHVGAFAVIRFGVYMLVNFGLLYELYVRGLVMGLVFLYALSRCMAAGSALTMQHAKKHGMLIAFTEKADRKRMGVLLVALTAFATAGWVCSTFPFGLISIALCVPLTLLYRNMARKNFGGITGDTTGFYIQILELALLAGLLIGGILAQWL